MFAGALVLNSLLGWNVMTTVTYIGIAVAIFTIIGGFTAVAYTDVIQVVIMLVGAVTMLFIGLDKVDGWSGLMAKAPDMMSIAKPYDDPVYPFWGILATAFYAGIFYWGIDQVNVQRTLAAPDIKNARWGAMFATLLKLLPVFIFALPGVIAYALFPGELERRSYQANFCAFTEQTITSRNEGFTSGLFNGSADNFPDCRFEFGIDSGCPRLHRRIPTGYPGKNDRFDWGVTSS